MPRIAKFTKDDIAQMALNIINEQGTEAVTARNLGKKLGVSSSPIFTMYSSMEEVLEAARNLGVQQFFDYIADVTDYTPAFKEFGMRLIRYAKKQRNVFSFLFLDKNANKNLLEEKIKEYIAETVCEFGLTEEQSEYLYRQMWVYACGLSVICAQNPMAHSDDEISQMISSQFMAIIRLIKSGAEVQNIEIRKKSNS